MSGIGLLHPFESKSERTVTRTSSRRSCFSLVSPWIWTLLVVSFTWIGFVALLNYKGQFHTASDGPVSCFCGNNLAEAKALGCKFDSVAAAWLPPACRDDENTEEFDRSGPGLLGEWTYYTDWDKTNTITLEEIANLPEKHGSFYTTHEWHIQHCLYVFRKIWRAPTTGVTVEKRFNTDMHLKHCGQMFMLRGPLDDVVTGSGVTLNADYIIPHKGH